MVNDALVEIHFQFENLHDRCKIVPMCYHISYCDVSKYVLLHSLPEGGAAAHTGLMSTQLVPVGFSWRASQIQVVVNMPAAKLPKLYCEKP